MIVFLIISNRENVYRFTKAGLTYYSVIKKMLANMSKQDDSLVYHYADLSNGSHIRVSFSYQNEKLVGKFAYDLRRKLEQFVDKLDSI